MKRFICVSVALAFILGCFAGCGKAKRWEPEQVSDDLEPYVERAVVLIDEYLAFEITAEEADEKLAELYSRMDLLGVNERDENYNLIDNGYSLVDQGAAWEIEALKYGIGQKTDIELLQSRDVLAYSSGLDVSGKRNFEASEYDRDEFSRHYDYMCGYDPVDITEFAKQGYDAITDGTADFNSMYFWYMCYGQYVFLIHITNKEGSHPWIEVCGYGSLDGIQHEDVSIEELDVVVQEMAGYFVGP